MKKAFAGVVILGLLLAMSFLSVRYLDRRIDALLACVDEAEQLALEKDFASAADKLQEAIGLWRGMDGYTHIFIRHAEIDGATDAFCELLGCLGEGHSGEMRGGFEKLRMHLLSIREMEHVSLGSVL